MELKDLETTCERKEGVELLRIISMLMIIAIHILGKGGLFDATQFGTWQNALVVILRSFVISSVNCYVLISGYFLVDKPFKCKRITRTILIVFEYSIILSILCFSTKQASLTAGNVVYSLIPVPMQDTYWFATQYVSLLVLSPFLNRLIASLSKNQHKMLIVICFLLFSVIPSLTIIKKSFFSTGNDIIWFCVLYSIAAYIRKYGVPSKTVRTCVMILGWVLTIAIYYGINGVSNILLGRVIDFATSFFSYISPFVVMTSLGLFGLFLDIEIKNKFIRKNINIIGKHTFGVYLWHNHFLFREIIWALLVPAKWVDNNPLIIFAFFVMSMVSIFVSGLIIDIVRSAIETLLLRGRKEAKVFIRIDEKMNKLLN